MNKLYDFEKADVQLSVDEFYQMYFITHLYHDPIIITENDIEEMHKIIEARRRERDED